MQSAEMVSILYFFMTCLVLIPCAGLKDIFSSGLVLIAAFSTCMGGLLFGFDQGILSIVLTMSQFLGQFPDVDANVSSSAAFNKG